MNPPSPTLPAPDPEKLRQLAALVARIEGGEAAAEAELVAQFSPGLKVILRRLTADAALAEDVHQETLAIALRRIRARELRQPEALPGFIRSTARNLVIAGRRKEARYADLAEEHGEILEGLEARAAADAGAPAGQPLARLIAEPGWRRLAVPLAVAALLAAALSPRLFGPKPGGAPTGPQAPAAVREITLAQLRGGPGDGPVLTLGDPKELLLFSLEKSPEFGGPFRLTLRRGETVLLQKDGLLADPARPLAVGICASLLTPGPLEFVVETLDAPPRPVGRYRVQVEPATPAP